jgi:hypothetical protein
LLKLDRAIIAAAVAVTVFWIEQHQRIDIGTPAGAAFAASVAPLCPDHDNVPYSTACIAFMEGSFASDRHRQQQVAQSKPDAPELSGPACPPNNENIPYSAACIKFMSGWFWQANEAENAIPASSYAPR